MTDRRILIAALTTWSFLACSDPAPPTPRGAATYRTYRASGATQVCTTGEGAIYATEPFGEGDPVGEPEPPLLNSSPTRRGGPVYDGEEGAEISCTVSGDGTFEIEASLEGPNQKVENRPTNISISDATIGADGTGTGRVSFFTSEILNVSASTTCDLQVVPDPSTGEPSIESGEVWLTFRCAETIMNSMVSGCSSEGTIVLENCRR